MFRFIKQIFISTIMFFVSLSNVNSLECVSMKNKEWKVRPEIININSIILYFILLVLRQINVIITVIILMIQI